MLRVDLNCDMGESTHLHQYTIEKDLALLHYVSSINLACGFHAGDAHTMHQLVESAVARKVAIGAHPSFEDREHFGRHNSNLPPEKIYDIVLYQLGALYAFLKTYKTKMHHVKPHGALYNIAAKDRTVADAISNAIFDFDEELLLYGLSGSELISSAEERGLKTASEVFADRSYQSDGSLTPRSTAGALIENADDACTQVLHMLHKGSVVTMDGTEVAVKAETVCIHGDGVHALLFTETIYNTLSQHHVHIKQP